MGRRGAGRRAPLGQVARQAPQAVHRPSTATVQPGGRELERAARRRLAVVVTVAVTVAVTVVVMAVAVTVVVMAVAVMAGTPGG